MKIATMPGKTLTLRTEEGITGTVNPRLEEIIPHCRNAEVLCGGRDIWARPAGTQRGWEPRQSPDGASVRNSQDYVSLGRCCRRANRKPKRKVDLSETGTPEPQARKAGLLSGWRGPSDD